MRKEQAPAPEILVPIEDVLAQLALSPNPLIFREDAKQLAEDREHRGQVTKDWAGRPCVGPEHARWMFLTMARDREQLSREQAEQLAEISQHGYAGPGIVGGEEPGEGKWEAPQVSPAARRRAALGVRR